MLLKWNIWTLTLWSLSLLNPDASKISKFVAGSPEGKFLPLAQENINPLTPPSPPPPPPQIHEKDSYKEVLQQVIYNSTHLWFWAQLFVS